ncbi:MAG TPA: nucleotidyltransferase domain-containing protein [Acidimicrobiia bacterium]|nr:nucleotidyltransferase domain-containing protein [Acidimicrobiia bacterium]
MRDPLEGVTPEGTIQTGVDRDRIRPPYRPIVDAAVALARDGRPEVAVYVYGSVATGRAQIPFSDVDILTIGLPAAEAQEMSRSLSSRFSEQCRAVQFAPGSDEDFIGPDDQAYGGRVFLHHYCAHLAGPDRDRATAGFPADRRAARGFNGDIASRLRVWRSELARSPSDTLGRRVARKTLFAVSGLVSIHDATWTTDREEASRRWSQIHPDLGQGLSRLAAWSSGESTPQGPEIEAMLDAVVEPVVEAFRDEIGLWRQDQGDHREP